MSMQNSKPVVLITGCSVGGIGYELCKAFSPSSKVVYATTRRLESMSGFPQGNIKTLVLDVCNAESIEKAVQVVLEEQGRLDIVVSNAGIGGFGPLLDVQVSKAQETFDANYFGTHRLALATVPHMAKQGSGKFIIIGSIAGQIPGPWNGTYSCSKAAVHTFADVLRMECAPFGVQVQLVIPGGVRSNIINNMEGKWALPEDSLHQPWSKAIARRFSLSQGPGAMPTDQFAATVAGEILKPKMWEWIMLGSFTRIIRVLMFWPRTLALRFMWWANS